MTRRGPGKERAPLSGCVRTKQHNTLEFRQEPTVEVEVPVQDRHSHSTDRKGAAQEGNALGTVAQLRRTSITSLTTHVLRTSALRHAHRRRWATSGAKTPKDTRRQCGGRPPVAQAHGRSAQPEWPQVRSSSAKHTCKVPALASLTPTPLTHHPVVFVMRERCRPFCQFCLAPRRLSHPTWWWATSPLSCVTD